VTPIRWSPQAADDLASIIVGAYRIVYRYRHDTVEITTIFHGARRFPANDP
jgi:plasmid stabilization system protein ParE